MLRSFEEIYKVVTEAGTRKKIALAAAHDLDALTSAANARKIGLADFILIGNVDEIKKILTDMGENLEDYEYIQTNSDTESANTAAQLVAEKKADAPMKGILHTSVFLKGMLNSQLGLVDKKALISQATVLYFEKENRMMMITDCAINIAPTFEEKMKITQNAVDFARKMQIDVPKVAIVTPLEEVKNSIPSTVEAAMLSKAADRKQIKNCIVDGPLALDNALSLEAAKHKKIESPVAGQADILVMPDLNAGNILDKSLRFFADYRTAGVVLGAKCPLVMTSRSDSAANKLNSIACAMLQAL